MSWLWSALLFAAPPPEPLLAEPSAWTLPDTGVSWDPTVTQARHAPPTHRTEPPRRRRALPRAPQSTAPVYESTQQRSTVVLHQ
jgi:hypothetical protein